MQKPVFLAAAVLIVIVALGYVAYRLQLEQQDVHNQATLVHETELAQAIVATSQARTGATQVFNATAQAGTGTPQSLIATNQVALSTPQSETGTAQAGIGTSQASTSTVQSGVATAQMMIATLQEERATSQPATATSLSGSATAQAATATVQAITATAQALENLRRVIGSIDYLPTNKPMQYVKVAAAPTEQVDYNLGAIVSCTPNNYQMADNRAQTTVLDINAANVWPGAVIEGRSLLQGVLVGVPFDRAPGTVTVVGLPGQRTKTVEAPSLDTVNAAIQQLLLDDPIPPTAEISFESKQIYSFDQAMAEAGIVVSPAFNDLKLQLGFGNTQKRSYVLVRFQQRYYTVVFRRDSPDPVSFFGGARINNVADYIGNGNPPAYVSSVDYGRELIMLVSSSEAGPDLEAAVNYMYEGSVGGYVGLRLAKILEQADVHIIAHGGSAEDVANIIAADFKSADRIKSMNEYLATYFASGANVSRSSLGAPISFQANYLKDDSVALLAYSTNYQSQDCVRSKPLAPSTFMVTLDQIRINHVMTGIPLISAMNICLEFGISSAEPDIPVKQVLCEAPISVRDGSIINFGAHSPLFRMSSQNDMCFRVYLRVSRKIALFTAPLGESDDPICYNDSLWVPPGASRSMDLQGGGIDLSVLYTLQKQ